MTEEHDTIAPPPESTFKMHGELPAIANLLVRLGKARNEMDTVLADTTGQFQNRTFKYADLASIYKSAIPALSKNGITVFHPNCQVGALQRATTILAGGEAMLEVSHDFSGVITYDTVKGFGALLTFLNRYQLRGLVAVAGDDDPDNDGKAGTQPFQQRSQPTPPAVTKSKEEPKNRPKQETVRPAEAPPAAQPPPLPKSEPPPAITMAPDDQKPDGELLVAGSAMSAALGNAFKSAGVDTDNTPLKVKRIILEVTGKSLGAPGVNLTYGDARLLLEKLPKMTPEQIEGTA